MDGGERLPRVSARHQEGLRRDFKITKRILKKYGFSQACSGCHTAQFGLRQGASREHTKGCTARIEIAIRSTGEDVRLLEDRDRRKARICQDAQREHKHDALDLRNDSVAEHPTPERDGGVADTFDTIGSDLDDNLQQHDNEHGRDDDVSVLESDQEVEGANTVRKIQSDEEALGGSKRRRLELLKTLNSTEIQNMVAHLDDREIRVLKALHKALVLKPFNDSAADSNADTAEGYSPPRISDAAARLGLKAAFALDLTEFDDNGKTWDLSDPQMQRRVLGKLREEKPWLLVVSSLCTPLSQLQHGNNGLKHLAFAVVLCLEQAAAGRKFALEQAAQASLCESDILKVLMRQSGALRVDLDHCTMGLTSRDPLGTAFAREITSIATNSNGIAFKLQKFQYDSTHGHVPTDRERVKQDARCVRQFVSHRLGRDMQQCWERKSLA